MNWFCQALIHVSEVAIPVPAPGFCIPLSGVDDEDKFARLSRSSELSLCIKRQESFPPLFRIALSSSTGNRTIRAESLSVFRAGAILCNDLNKRSVAVCLKYVLFGHRSPYPSPSRGARLVLRPFRARKSDRAVPGGCHHRLISDGPSGA